MCNSGFSDGDFACSLAMFKVVICVDISHEKSNKGKTKAWLWGSSYVTVWIKSTLIQIKATNVTFLFFFVVCKKKCFLGATSKTTESAYIIIIIIVIISVKKIIILFKTGLFLNYDRAQLIDCYYFVNTSEWYSGTNWCVSLNMELFTWDVFKWEIKSISYFYSLVS